nr:serine/threonine protein kinase [Cryptococcus depauperatus CBS 7841]
MERLPYRGSTSAFFLITPGTVVKTPLLDLPKNQTALRIEQQLLERLGKHPRIIPYLGPHPSGILLAQAPHGDLQTYIDTKHATLSTLHCWSLWEQVTEAIVHLHSKGVIHSDLRPDNFLVYQAPQPFASIWLCDLGGSFCAELDLDGGHLPDIPFSDPQMGIESTPATDIFSLGSIFYAILTGYWPFLDRPPKWTSTEDYFAYYDRAVELLKQRKFPDVSGLDAVELLKQRKFPDVSGLDGGDVIKGCWDLEYKSAEEVLQAVRSKMAATDV